MADNFLIGIPTTLTRTIRARDLGGDILAQGIDIFGADGFPLPGDNVGVKGPLFPVAGTYQAVPSLITDGAVGRKRMTERRVGMTAADSVSSLLDALSPTAGGDITEFGGVPLTSGDFDIRDLNVHNYIIPVAFAGWRHIGIGCYIPVAFDRTLTFVVDIIHQTNVSSAFYSRILSVSVPPGSTSFGVGEVGIGQGGSVGGASVTASSHYQIPNLGRAASLRLAAIATGAAPTTGSLQLNITRMT